MNLLLLLLLLLPTALSSSSICSQYYPSPSGQCECEDLTTNNQAYVSLKCFASSTNPTLFADVHYRMIEFDSCLEDLHLGEKLFTNLNVNILRIRHCQLADVTERTFANINHLEKFYFENVTMHSLNEHLQDLFASNSFQTLKSLTLKNVHYPHASPDKKLNLELLLQQLPKLYRLELINIHMDNYRHTTITAIGEHLTYLSLTNTHQTSLLPIEYLGSLERLLLRHLPDVFHTQALIGSLGQLKKLKYILFEHNQLKTVERLQSDSIDDIDLSSNLIERLDEFAFEHVPKLRQLTLSGNPLAAIDANAFCGIENLQRLSIHSKHSQISPLDNCLLLNYPQLQIIQESQTKLQCNCQLLELFQRKRQQTNEMNRLLKLNQVCLLVNATANYHRSVHVYELESSLNCSSSYPCQRSCVERRVKSLQATLTDIGQVNSKMIVSSASSHFSAFFSLLLAGVLSL